MVFSLFIYIVVSRTWEHLKLKRTLNIGKRKRISQVMSTVLFELMDMIELMKNKEPCYLQMDFVVSQWANVEGR